MEFRKTYNDNNQRTVTSSTGVYTMFGFNEVKSREGRRERTKERNRSRKKVKDYVKTLAKATENSNQQLEKKGIPFRYCVYTNNDLVYIDFVTLDPKGKIKKTVTKDVTDEDFNTWINNIAFAAGLNIDKKA